MDLHRLESSLWRAARSEPPADHVPYGFTQRVMASLRASRAPDPWVLWGRGLGRAMAPALAIFCLTLLWQPLHPDESREQASLRTDFEQALYAPFAHMEETW